MMDAPSPAVPSVWLDVVLAGQVRPFTRPGTFSAIAKAPVQGAVRIGAEGIEGDAQGDRRIHGGPDKAIHHYPFEHYVAWRQTLGFLPLLDAPGAFGENFSTQGWTEADVCLGDRVRAGSALLEVSQARQPCWKLNDRFGVSDMARRVQHSGRTGWYYRVIEPGICAAGERLECIARPFPAWTLSRLLTLLYGPGLDSTLLSDALGLPLVPSWRRLIEARLARGQVEDWRARLQGPPLA